MEQDCRQKAEFQRLEIMVDYGKITAAQVYPAAKLLRFFLRDVKEKYFIAPNPAYEVLDGLTILKGTASEKMPEIIELISANFQ